MPRIVRSLALTLAFALGPWTALHASSPAPVQSDRTEAYEEALLNHVNRNEYLRRLEFEWVWDYPGYVVIVQKPWNMAEGYVEKTAKFQVADSLAMHKRFQEGHAKRHGLSMRPKSPRMMILVLEDFETLCGYLSDVLRQKVRNRTSHYDTRNRMLVVCETPFSNFTARRDELRKREMHWRAVQILQVYSARSDRLPGPYWLHEGLAKELAGLHDRQLTRKLTGKTGSWVFQEVGASMQNPAVGPSTLLPLLDLLTIQNYRENWERAASLAADAGIQPPQGIRVHGDFQATSGALVQFLTYHASEELIESMGSFTEAAFKDNLRKKPFRAHFKDVDWATVEQEFWTYVWDRWQAETGGTGTDRSGLELLLARGLEGSEPVEAAVPPAGAAASLLDAPEESDAQLAIALGLVLAGEPEAAEARLATALEVEPDPAKRKRLEREILRVRAWTAERDGYFQHLIDTGEKLSLKLGGKKLLTEVVLVEEGQLTLGDNNRGFSSLPLKGLDPVQLASIMGSRKSTYEAGWALAYPGAMDPGTRKKRWLKGDEPERIQLSEDAKGDYKARGASIEAARHLVALCADDLVDVYDRGEQTPLEHLKALWALREEVAWVKQLEGALPGRAAVLLGREFDDRPISDFLAVPFHPDSNGMVELVYDFNDPDQLRDWPLDPAEMHDRARWESTNVTASFLRVEGGKLSGLGEASRTHVLDLKGVQSLSWKQVIYSGGNVVAGRNATVRVGLCADDEGGYAALFHSMDVEVTDGRGPEYIYQSSNGFGNRFDLKYQRELKHDGEGTLTALSNGKEVVTSSAGSRKRGRAQIFLHTDYAVEISQVVIRGQLTEESFDLVRESWIRNGLAELGLGK